MPGARVGGDGEKGGAGSSLAGKLSRLQCSVRATWATRGGVQCCVGAATRMIGGSGSGLSESVLMAVTDSDY
jgi:hypothetical protein